MPAPTRSPRSRPHGAPAVIWCTRAETSPAAAASVRIETPSARAEASCPGAFPLGLLQAPRRPGYPLQYRPLPPPSGHPVRDRHADTLAGVQLTRQPRRFGAPLLPAPRVGRRRLGRCGLVRKGLFVSAEH